MLMMTTLILHYGKLQRASNEGIFNRIGSWLNNASILDSGNIYGSRFVVIDRGIDNDYTQDATAGNSARGI